MTMPASCGCKRTVGRNTIFLEQPYPYLAAVFGCLYNDEIAGTANRCNVMCRLTCRHVGTTDAQQRDPVLSPGQ